MTRDTVQEEIAEKFGKRPVFEKIRKTRKSTDIDEKRKMGLKKANIKRKMKSSGII